MISHIPRILFNFKASDFFVLFKHCHLTSGTRKSYTQKICISIQQIYLLIKTMYKNLRGDNRHYQYTGSTEKKKMCNYITKGKQLGSYRDREIALWEVRNRKDDFQLKI